MKKVFYLSLTQEAFTPGRELPQGGWLLHAADNKGRGNKFMYRTLGEIHQWNDRKEFTDQQWAEFVRRDLLDTTFLMLDATLAGYFELKKAADDSIEILLFGILPACQGRGLGSALLTAAVQRAFSLGARTVILNTCTDDHPHALANYKARGFTVDREVEAKE